ncbi:MAG: hypothetical protein WAJ85_01290 [Candidatus Baltobacteraceae bacterium]|jgi:hypothetical protein
MKTVRGKAAVLILASSYDTGSFYTHAWARALHEDLVTQGHAALFVETEAVCRTDSSLSDAIAAAHYVIFYGHGTKDQWTAIPGAPGASGLPLIGVETVDRFADRGVYAACCSSLADLGAAYARKFPQGQYVGYSGEFSFEVTNRNLFGDVVNASIVAFVKGAPAAQVHADLKNEWERLRDDFLPPGRYQHNRNAVMASQRAADNAARVGHKPS